MIPDMQSVNPQQRRTEEPWRTSEDMARQVACIVIDNHLDAAAAVVAADAPAVKLPLEPLPFVAACVWFWATVRRLVLSLLVVAHVMEPCAGTNAPWLGC